MPSSTRGEAFPDYANLTKFDAWLTRLLVRSCQDVRRRARRRVVELPLLVRRRVRMSTDHQAAFAVTDQIERGLQGLTVDQRTVLVLSFYLDLPVAEAAAILGIPAGTMKSRLHRAISALRATVEADDRPIARTAERTT